MLKELLPRNHIRCTTAPASWQEAIRLAAAPLLDCGAILPSYVDAMIRSVEENGPYIVIDENFAMPHARPEAGAVRPCMALTILDRPIDMCGQSVQVLLALSATDNTSHLDAMRELAELIWNGCSASVLAGAASPEDAMAIIERTLSSMQPSV